MFCEKCGSKITKGNRFCEKCGNPVEYGEQPEIVHKRGYFRRGILAAAGCAVAAIIVVVALFLNKGGEDATGQTDKIPKQDVAIAETPTPAAGTPLEMTSTPMATDSPESEEMLNTEPEETEAGQEDDGMEDVHPDEEDMEEKVMKVDMELLKAVTASSVLFEANTVHSAEQICDGRLKKAWVEGEAGQGIGESVSFIFWDELRFSGMKINAGYQKSKDLYYKNSRPKRLKLTFSDGSIKKVKLKDSYGIQKIKFDKPVNAKEVSVAIESVYKGNKYNDTVISELSWF